MIKVGRSGQACGMLAEEDGARGRGKIGKETQRERHQRAHKEDILGARPEEGESMIRVQYCPLHLQKRGTHYSAGSM